MINIGLPQAPVFPSHIVQGRVASLVSNVQEIRILTDNQVNQGEIVGLLGPNGAGKTTSFYMIVGFVKPDVGHVYLGNEDITNLAMYKRARKGIGYLPQEASVFRKLSVEDNIKAILEMTSLNKSEQKAKM